MELLGVSSDSHSDSRKMVRIVKGMTGLDLTFPLLADAGHRVIDRYGLLNMGTAAGPETRRFATPGTFILDKSGVVRWRVVEDNWKVRPTNRLILAALDRVRSGKDASDLTLQSLTITDPPPTVSAQTALRRGGTDHMVLIPAGPFTMGQKGRFGIDSRDHQVVLNVYYMDEQEVTNRDYRLFLADLTKTEDHGRCYPSESPHKDHTPKYWKDARYDPDDFPVVGVDWWDAYAYCAWAGKQLPTEAQWERAARGGVEGQGRESGNGPMDESLANVNGESGESGAAAADRGTVLPDHHHGPKPVASYQPNGLRLFDMRGNAEEWIFDWYAQDYYLHSPSENPPGPTGGVLKVVRGGSWHHGNGRSSTRYTREPGQREFFLGFRCVRPAPSRLAPALGTDAKLPGPGLAPALGADAKLPGPGLAPVAQHGAQERTHRP